MEAYILTRIFMETIGGIELDERPVNILTPRIEFLAKFAKYS